MKKAYKKKYLPMLYDVSEKSILIIGAGLACREKLRTLKNLQKNITVISSSFHEDFLRQDWLTLIPRKYESGDLKRFDIVYVGVNHPPTEKQIAQDAQKLLPQKQVFINFLSSPQNSHFIAPSFVARENFSIFISSYGKAPAAVKMIRQEIEKQLDLDKLDKETAKLVHTRKKKQTHEK